MFSTTTPAQIRDHPVNNSSAKIQWSFSKDSRFKDPKPNCRKSNYETKATTSGRAASIGYGSRSTYFEGKKDTIDPGRYNLGSSFDLRRSQNKKGYSFTNNREELSFSNYLKQNQKTPSPFQYQSQSRYVKTERGSYSMRKKTSYPKNYFLFSQKEERRKRQDPGPGKYQTIDFVGGKYHLSASKNAMGSSFIGNERFNQDKVTPGPGDYQVNTLQADGRTVLSNMRSSGRRAIMQDKRELKLDGNKYTPGPGSYRQPSDFGHYQSNYRPSTARR